MMLQESRDSSDDFTKPLAPSAPGGGPTGHSQNSQLDSDSNVDMLLHSPSQSNSHADKS